METWPVLALFTKRTVKRKARTAQHSLIKKKETRTVISLCFVFAMLHAKTTLINMSDNTKLITVSAFPLITG